MDALAEAGFTEIELMVTRDPVTQNAEHPLTAGRGAGPQDRLDPRPLPRDHEERLGHGPRREDQAGGRDVPGARRRHDDRPPALPVGAGLRPTGSPRKPRLSPSETGVMVAVETMYPKWVAGRKLRGPTAGSNRRLWPTQPRTWPSTRATSPLPGRTSSTPSTSWPPKLDHIHLSNNAGDGRDGHLELEQGVLPLERFLARVAPN